MDIKVLFQDLIEDFGRTVSFWMEAGGEERMDFQGSAKLSVKQRHKLGTTIGDYGRREPMQTEDRGEEKCKGSFGSDGLGTGNEMGFFG